MTSFSSDVFFCFGPTPGSYILDTVRSFKHFGMPSVLIDAFAKEPGLRKIHTLAVGENSEHWAYWIQKDGLQRNFVSDNATKNYSGLTPKVKDWAHNFGGASVSVCIAHGADSGACYSKAEYHTWGLDEHIRKQIGEHKGVRHIALGLGGACIFIHANGGTWRDLKGHYPTLEGILSKNNLNTTFVALNGWRADEFVIIHNNETAYFKLHHSISDEVEKTLKCEGYCVYNLTARRPCAGCSCGSSCQHSDKIVCPTPKPTCPPPPKPGCGCSSSSDHKASGGGCSGSSNGSGGMDPAAVGLVVGLTKDALARNGATNTNGWSASDDGTAGFDLV